MQNPWGVKLGQGRQGEVFAYGNDKAVKCFYPNMPLNAAEHEFKMAGIINEYRLPTPKAYELILANGRHGIVYEKVEGTTLLTLLLSDASKMNWAGETCARLQAEVHQCRNDNLPSLTIALEHSIQKADIAPSIRDTALRLLSTLPEGNAICHGDFHPDNVVLSPTGPVILDWANAKRGSRIADFVFSALLLKMGEVPDFVPKADVFNRSRAALYKSFTRTYLSLAPASMEEIAPWILPVAIARLADCPIESERPRLLKIIERLGKHYR